MHASPTQFRRPRGNPLPHRFAARVWFAKPVRFFTWAIAWALACIAGDCPTMAQQVKSVLNGPIVSSTPATKTDTSVVDDAGGDTIDNAIDNSANNPAGSATTRPDSNSNDAGEDIDRLLTNLVLNSIPHEFENNKDWGGQKERWDGVKFRRKGLEIKTKRRKKMVNHGTWKKYKVALIDPKNQFSISVKNMRESGDEKLAFDIYFGANLKINGRQSKWIKGVQLYSVSVSGQAKVQLKATIELESRLDISNFPPDIIFRPKATDADITLEEFRIDRVGKLGGEVAQQATKLARDAIEEKIAEKQDKLLQKINRQFDKKKDKLRLSLHDAVSSKWTDSAKVFLPNDIQNAIDSTQ